MAIRFISKATVKNKLPRSSNIWDGTAVFNPFTLVGNYDALATVTVPSGGVSSITFAGIPQTGYSHLQVRILGRSDGATGNSWAYYTFNNDGGTNYSSHYLQGDGSTASANAQVGSGSNTEIRANDFPRADATTGIFGAAIVDIFDAFSTTKNKTVRALGGNDRNGSGRISLYSGAWYSTAAINSIKVTPQTNNWVQYTQIALYGVK